MQDLMHQINEEYRRFFGSTGFEEALSSTQAIVKTCHCERYCDISKRPARRNYRAIEAAEATAEAAAGSAYVVVGEGGNVVPGGFVFLDFVRLTRTHVLRPPSGAHVPCPSAA